MTKVFDMKGKHIKPKKNFARDAARFKQIMAWLESGLATLTIAGTIIDRSELNGVIGSIDSELEDEKKSRINDKVKKHRSRKKKM